MSKTILAQEISRVQNMYDSLYADDPEYGIGPYLRRDLDHAKAAFDRGEGVDFAIQLLREWSLSPNIAEG